MSARAVLVAGVAARLKTVLAGCAVFDAPPVRSGFPFAVVEEPVLADWSGTTWEGRDGRLAITIADAGEQPVRLRALLGAAETAIETMPGDLGGGWKVLMLRLAKSRMRRAGDRDRWVADAEFRVRVVRLNG